MRRRAAGPNAAELFPGQILNKVTLNLHDHGTIRNFQISFETDAALNGYCVG